MTQVKNRLSYFHWLLFLVKRWVRFTVNPKDLHAELQLKETDKVCYVVRVDSLLDLMVLWSACERYSLPLPHISHVSFTYQTSTKFGSYIALRKENLFSVRKPPSHQEVPLLNYIEHVEHSGGEDIKLVPVSIFWGRNPGRDEKSIMKLLFLDDEHAGFFQKIFVFLAQGRSTFVQFGKPISMSETLSDNKKQKQGGLSHINLARKITRVLKVHFRLQRNAVLGPHLPTREQVTQTLLRRPALKAAIDEEARKRRISYDKVEKKAQKYMLEIISNQKYSFIRIADVFMTWLWNRLFNGVKIVHSHRLREIDPSHEIIYMPSHRSHMDYLLLAYVLYYEGMVPPHTAAGVNLNFWPVGALLRMGGAFYLRRTFSGNRLYATVFSEYVHYLVTKGHPIKFYLEGGRSRTGRLLPGKTGLLSMIVQAHLERRDKPVVFVPIYVGYDKVMELKSYHSELRGAKKKNESMSQLFKARSALKTRFGKAYIGFGEPIYLKDFLDKSFPNWAQEDFSLDSKPKWLGPAVSKLAQKTLVSINKAAILSPMGLFGLVMLSIPAKALAEEDLCEMMVRLRHLISRCAYVPDLSAAQGTGQELLRQVAEVFNLRRFQHPSGDVIYLESSEVIELGYYRNNIAHLVALPALIAAFFNHNTLIKESVLKKAVNLLYPFLHKDLFLDWLPQDIGGVIDTHLEELVQLGLIVRESSDGYEFLRRPEVISHEMSLLRILAGTLGPLMERYALCIVVLIAQQEKSIKKVEFEKNCAAMARRIAILGGTPETELFEKSTIQQFLTILVENDYIETVGEDQYQMCGSLAELEMCALFLLSHDMRQGIIRVKKGHDPGEPIKSSVQSGLTIN